MRTNNPLLPQDSSGIPFAAASQPRGHKVPGDSGLRITWAARSRRPMLAGDIDLTTHTAMITALASTEDATAIPGSRRGARSHRKCADA